MDSIRGWLANYGVYSGRIISEELGRKVFNINMKSTAAFIARSLKLKMKCN